MVGCGECSNQSCCLSKNKLACTNQLAQLGHNTLRYHKFSSLSGVDSSFLQEGTPTPPTGGCQANPILLTVCLAKLEDCACGVGVGRLEAWSHQCLGEVI